MKRLEQLSTLRIDSAKMMSFDYNGKPFQGAEGDTVATALYSNGIRIFSRSIKYHRPRGLYSLDGESGNCLMEVNGIPNIPAETTLLKNGMAIKPQNIVGTPERDLLGFLDKLGWAMPAGFFVRTLHKPAKLWPIAAKFIRKAAGLGVLASDFQMEGKYDEIYPTADVCVIGGGPAGILAALTAAEQNLRVIILESRPWLGGFFEYRAAEYRDGIPLYRRARELFEKLKQMPDIRIFTHTPVVGVYPNNLITAFQVGDITDPFCEKYVEIRTKSVVVATGCIERPLLFENNERPGIMQIGCAHRLARTYGLLPGERAVFCIGHDLGLEAALDLFALGVDIACVADIRTEGQDERLLAELAERGIPFFRGWVAVKAYGSKTVRKVALSTIDGTRHQALACDLLVASAGMTPITDPLSLAQAELSYDHHTGFYLPKKLPAKMHAAGRMLGFTDAISIEASGRLAGLMAAADCGKIDAIGIKEAKQRLDRLPGPANGSKLIKTPGNTKKCFICFDADTTTKDIVRSIKMGFDEPELIKRFTAAGTGPGQGRIPGHNLPLFAAKYHADACASLKPTTVRPPLVPAFIATYAGTNRDMCKRTPVHASQKKAGCIMRRVGVWKRARYFSNDISSRKEILNVRNNVGMIDVSTLGKFRIFGPDALKALQRVYVGDMSRVSVGKSKYSAMCNEDGCLMDDGVVTKRGDIDYYFTTSTGRAGSTAEWIRYHTRYDRWDFHMVNLTDAFGAINLAGPKARKVLQKMVHADISNETFPYMGYREFTVAGSIPIRVFRLGFVGELSYEIHVPASYMQSLWDLLEKAGKEFGIRPFGLEAQSTLRLEKGHIIIGLESEQRTTLHDVGLGHLWYRSKPEAKTVGAVALKHTEKQEGRLKLVGFKMEDPHRTPKDGSVIVDSAIRGYVCTARYSLALDQCVGMGMVEDSMAKAGTRLEIYEDGCGSERLYGTVVPIPFYDPEGTRLRK